MLTVPAIFREALTALEGLVFEDGCAVCHRPRAKSDWPNLCAPCAERLPRIEPPYCPVCGEWFVGQITALARCSNCAGRRFHFDFAWAPFQARGAVRELVHSFKYENQLWLSRLLGGLLSGAIE